LYYELAWNPRVGIRQQSVGQFAENNTLILRSFLQSPQHTGGNVVLSVGDKQHQYFDTGFIEIGVTDVR
jgi:hypothetical protein